MQPCQYGLGNERLLRKRTELDFNILPVLEEELDTLLKLSMLAGISKVYFLVTLSSGIEERAQMKKRAKK